MNNIRETVDNFLAAAERLKDLTVQINEMADALEPALAGSGALHSVTDRVGPISPNYVDQMPTATKNYPLPPAGPMPDYSLPAPQQPAPSFTPEQMEASLQAAVASGEAPSGVFVPDDSPVLAQQTVVSEQQAAAQGNPLDTNPFEQSAPAAPTEKKGGRRTNEEMAAENGVDLADVRKWLGEGKRITKGAIEEFAKLGRAAGPAPVPLPAQASDPFGQGVAQPVSPPQAPVAAAEPHAPAAIPPTPENPFGQLPENPWAGQGEAVTDWSPFQ